MFYLIIGVLLSVLLLLFLYSRLKKTPVTDEFIDPATTEEAAAFASIRDALKDALVEKNGWDAAKFELSTTFNDRTFTTATIISDDTAIPTGMVLASPEGENFKIVFDSTTPEPCSLLEEGVNYPQSVLEFCEIELEETSPFPTDVTNN